MSIHIKDILLDIEGTTSSIRFVHEVLFPYARERIAAFIEAHRGEEDVRQQLELAKKSLEAMGRPSANEAEITSGLIRFIDEDVKDTALKALQGMIWREGYKNGDYKGHVYSDVRPTLEKWKEDGLRISIYSSGSVTAQKLIFGYSEAGDLCPLLSEYFDTRVGHKRDQNSYKVIAEKLGTEPASILFLSDISEELAAAAAVGYQVMQVYREAKPKLPSEGEPLGVGSLAEAREQMRVTP